MLPTLIDQIERQDRGLSGRVTSNASYCRAALEQVLEDLLMPQSPIEPVDGKAINFTRMPAFAYMVLPTLFSTLPSCLRFNRDGKEKYAVD